MNKTNGRIAINHILNMMKESEHIDSDFAEFIDNCISSYLHDKKLVYPIETIFEFRKHWLDEKTIKKYALGEKSE